MNTSWAARPLFTLPARAGRVLWVIVILAAVSLFVSPGIMTLGWHLFRGNTIEMRGKKVFVPIAWIAETDGGRDVSLMKLPLSLLHGLRFDGLILVSQNLLPPDKKTEEVYRSFETGYWTFADSGALVTVRCEPVQALVKLSACNLRVLTCPIQSPCHVSSCRATGKPISMATRRISNPSLESLKR